VKIDAHCPSFGVKVYVVSPNNWVLIPIEFHVPIIELSENVGNGASIGAPKQNVSFGPNAKVGVMATFDTTISKVV
jgi:hypothetical protein